MVKDDDSNDKKPRMFAFDVQVVWVRNSINNYIQYYGPPYHIGDLMSYWVGRTWYIADAQVDYKTVYEYLEEKGEIRLDKSAENWEHWEFWLNESFGTTPNHQAKIDLGLSLTDKIRADAEIMAELFGQLFVVERSMRLFISNKLMDKYGDDWWDKGIPDTIASKVERNIDDPRRKYHDITISDPMDNLFLGDFKFIIEENWDVFKNTFGKIENIKAILVELEIPRNTIGHSNILPNNEIVKFKENVSTIMRLIT